MPKKTRAHEQSVIDQLNDDDYAIAYLNAAIDEANEADDPRGILLALRRIAEAKGIGMTKLAKATEVNRQGMYKILSEQGNPEFLTLFMLFKALGLSFQVKKFEQHSQ
ncbi:MAG: hypothetical protein FD167_5837 [bacterium]|nr:MAG: hypothetical protein FD167_5837 [bacterium]